MEYASSRFKEDMDFCSFESMKSMDFNQAHQEGKRKDKKGKDKKLHGTKRKIGKIEQEYAAKTGHKPTLTEKMNNKEVKKLMSEKGRVDPGVNERRDVKNNKKDFVNFGESFRYPENLENIDGLYEKYRIQMKRMARRSSSVISWDSASDLQTIPEDRDIPLTLASPPERIILKVSMSSGCKEVKKEYRDIGQNGQNDGSIVGAHVSLEELLDIQEQYKMERHAQRKLVKLSQKELEKGTGIELSVQGKEAEKTYEEYKKTKGKVRLIDALLNKMFDNDGTESKNDR